MLNQLLWNMPCRGLSCHGWRFSLPSLDPCFAIHIWYPQLMQFPSFLYAGSFPIAFNWQFHKARSTAATHRCTRFGLRVVVAFMQVLWIPVFLIPIGWYCCCLIVLPYCVQFDFVKLLDGKALPRSLTDPVSTAKAPKGLLLSGLQETGFIEYMDPGTWHLALYNDGRNLEQVLLHSTPIGEDNCHILTETCDFDSWSAKDVLVMAWIFVLLL